MTTEARIPERVLRVARQRVLGVRPCLARLNAVWLLAAGAILLVAPVRAAPQADGSPDESSPAESASRALDYIMILGPADRKNEWRPRDASYWPVAPDRFREMIQQAHPGIPATIRSATYQTQFKTDQLVDGHATLKIEHLGPIETTLPLEPCNLAIERPGWTDRDETASLGLGPGGYSELRVKQSGRLDFDWSLRGSRETLGGVRFEIQLPPCPASRLQITMPDDRIPLVSVGIVLRGKPSLPGMRTWTIELGGENRVSLRIAPQEDPEGHSRLTELREELFYNFSPGGLQVTVNLRFDLLGQPLSQFRLRVPSQLTLLSIQDGDAAVNWGEVASKQKGIKEYVVEPEAPLRGLDRELVLEALASIRLDKSWRLPCISVPEVNWRESTAWLTVEHPLRLNDVVADDARILRTRRRNADGVDLQLFSQEATIDVVLGQEVMTPKVDYGVAIAMSGDQITAKQKVLLETEEGEHFQVVGEVMPAWGVDSVQADQAEAISDWQVTSKRQLVVDLKHPVSSENPLLLTVSARRLESTEDKVYRSSDMIPVDFSSARLGAALAALRAVEPFQLELSGTESLEQRDPWDLSARQQQLFAETPRGKIFVLGSGDEELAIQIRPRRAAYSGEIDSVVSVEGRQATERFVFRIDPQEAIRLDEVRIELPARPDVPIRWECTPGDEARPAGGESPTGSPKNGLPMQRWDFHLHPSRSEPFEIVATRVFLLEDGGVVGLATLPDASQQKGRVAIGISRGESVRIENRSLTSELPGSPDGLNGIPRATYRYDPAQLREATTAPLVLQIAPTAPDLPDAWIWSCRLESRLEATGRGRHTATYRIESVGAPSLHLRLPPAVGADCIESIEINGEHVPIQMTSQGERTELEVRLDTTRRFHELTLCYHTSTSPWSILQSVEVPIPEPDVPVLKRSWFVWLPPDRRVLELDGVLDFPSKPKHWPASAWGRVARNPGQGPFDPFSPAIWPWTGSPESPRNHDDSPTPRGETADSSVMAFGEFLNRTELTALWDGRPPETVRPRLLVDRQAASEQGLTPQTEITLPASADRTTQLASALDRLGLAIVVSRQQVLLTSTRKAAAWGNRVPGEYFNIVWEVKDSDRADQITQLCSGPSPSLILASQWIDLPRHGALPWKTPSRPGYEPRDMVGWSVWERTLQDSDTAALMTVDGNVLRTCLWGCFLVTALLIWAVARRSVALSVLPVAVLFVTTAYCSHFWTPWLSACFCGGMIGLFLRLATVRRPRALGRAVATHKATDTASQTGTVVTSLLIIAIGFPLAARAAEPEQPPESPALIWVPAEGRKPTGDDYYVPETFLTKLLNQASEIEARTPDWLLREADYHGSLVWLATGESLTVNEFTAEFGIEVIRPNTRVLIPFGETVGNWNIKAAWIDGRAVEDPTWEPAAEEPDDKPVGFAFSAEASSWYRVKLQLQPILSYGLQPGGFHLNIPPVPTSRLKLTIPADAPPIEIPSAAGHLFQQPLKIEAELGPVDRLEVKWQQTGRASSRKATRVSELLWMNVSVGGALIDAQFHFDLGQDSHQGELELIHDPRLDQRGNYEVQGATLDHVDTVAAPADGNGQPLIRDKLSLTEVQGTKVVVQGQFVVRDASGIGNLRLPCLRSEGFDVSQRWVAATVDPQLQYDKASQGQVTPIGVSEFVDAWVGEPDLPTLAVRLDSKDASFGLKTRPNPPRSTAQWKMAVGYGLKETLFDYQANVDTTAGYLFQHRLVAPPSLAIDEVVVTVDGVPRDVRWTRSRPTDQVVLFFDTALSGKHTIVLRGHTDAAGPRTEPLQPVVLESAENDPGTIDVYRQHDAIVSLESVEGMKELGPPAGIAVDERLGRIVTRWGADGQQAISATAHVQPNTPKVIVREQVLSLTKTADGWTATADFTLDVASGIVDRICLETPDIWPGPYDVSPGMVKEPTDAERGPLVLVAPQKNQLEFSVSGRLVPQSGANISVPPIRLKDVEYSDKTARLVVLPVGPIPVLQWQTVGLVPTDVPSRFAAKAPGPMWEAYLVQQDDFQATLRPTPDAAQVAFADVRLDCDASGQCRGVALFDIEAGDRKDCRLRVPSPWRLVAVSNHGVPLSSRRNKDDTWTIPLGRTALPQRVEIVFAGSIPLDTRSSTRIDAFPEIQDLPVLEALCTVASDAPFEVVGVWAPIRCEQAAMKRLHNVTASIAHALERPGSSPDEEKAWYRGWLGEWTETRREAEFAVAMASRVSPAQAEQAELQALDQLVKQHSVFAQWQANEARASRLSPAVLWDRTHSGHASKYYFSSKGASPLVLRIDSPRANGNAQFAASPVVYVSAFLLVLAVAWATGRLHRWPHFFGVLLGLAWWLWLSPSVLGLGLVAVCLLAAVRSGWRRPRSSGSALVHLSASGRV